MNKTRLTGKFRAKSGAQFSDEKAKIYGKELYRLAKAKGGFQCLKPEDIWNAAKAKKSPLHDAYVWDVDKVLEIYGLQQSRQIMNHIEVEIKHPDGMTSWKSGFHSVDVELIGGEDGLTQRLKAYIPVVVMAQEGNIGMRDNVIESFLNLVLAADKKIREIINLGDGSERAIRRAKLLNRYQELVGEIKRELKPVSKAS